MNPTERISALVGSDVRLVDITRIVSPAEIMWFHNYPYRTCLCCGGEAWHHDAIVHAGVMLVRSLKCGDCDEAGLSPYICWN